MKNTEYSMHRSLPGVAFDEAIEVVTAALKAEGFGVLTSIDVAQTLKMWEDDSLFQLRTTFRHELVHVWTNSSLGPPIYPRTR